MSLTMCPLTTLKKSCKASNVVSVGVDAATNKLIRQAVNSLPGNYISHRKKSIRLTNAPKINYVKVMVVSGPFDSGIDKTASGIYE